MPKQEIEQKQRISPSYGRVMILVGAFFDLIPILLVIGAIGLTVYGMGATFGGTVKSIQNADDACSWSNLMLPFGVHKCLAYKGSAGAKVALSLASGIGVGIFIGPTLYVFGSYLSSITAYIFLSLWFLLKGVNIWSFSNTKKVITNVSSIIVENIPVLNLLPGITLMVWRHVKISQMEDHAENSEGVQKISRIMNAKKVSG